MMLNPDKWGFPGALANRITPRWARSHLALPPRTWPRSTTVEVMVTKTEWDAYEEQERLMFEQGSAPYDEDTWDRLEEQVEALGPLAGGLRTRVRQHSDTACRFAGKEQACWFIEGSEVGASQVAVRLTVGVYFGEDIAGAGWWWDDPMTWPLKVRKVKRFLGWR